MTFQRARSEEQREIRRRAILDTTSAMLDEMPVAEVTLNELSRRVGLAKPACCAISSPARRSCSTCWTTVTTTWLAELASELADGVDRAGPRCERAEQMADRSADHSPPETVLCDLFGAQGGVLEHNVSVEVVRRTSGPPWAT